MSKGIFLTIEGVDGAGKTTQMNRLHEYLTEQGIDVITTREPGGTTVAEAIRSIHLTPTDETIDPYTELLLMYAARQQHLTHVIRPALANGTWVLCDRFIDTTFAYQIRGRRLDPAVFHQLNELIVRDTLPDFTLFFDLPVDIQGERLSARTDKSDRLDTTPALYKERVLSGLLERAHTQGHLIVDANADVDTVTQRMLDILEPFFNLKTDVNQGDA